MKSTYLNPRDKEGKLCMYRKIALIIAEPLSKTFITPRHVTVFGMVLTFLCIFFFINAQWILGGICWVLGKQMDYVDGSLARVRNAKRKIKFDSKYKLGKWLDMAADQFNTYFPFVGMAVGLASYPFAGFLSFLSMLNVLLILKFTNWWNHQ